jgi:CheY-like chemotaxis protein
VAFIAKPVKTRETLDILLDTLTRVTSAKRKRLLFFEPDAAHQQHILDCAAAAGGDAAAVADQRGLVEAVLSRNVDCLVIGTQVLAASSEGGAPDGHEHTKSLELESLVKALDRDPVAGQLPVILYGEHGLDPDDNALKRLSATGAARQVRSPERLLDEMTFFLHSPASKLPPEKRQILEELHSSQKILPGKRVLIVDDDMRNIFALSAILEERDMLITSADNGRQAIRALREDPDIDIVLMDIMMPEMDGIDTIREIRKVPRLKSVPIIAVTAKAMKGDREKCIEAGAWDYLSKPVDTQQLLAVLRAWLHR